MPLSETLAEYLHTVSYNTLPPAVVSATKIAFLDWLGNTIVGSQTSPAQMTHRVIATQGGRGDSTVVGWHGAEGSVGVCGNKRMRSTTLWATLANGVSSHTIELDDVHKASILHAGTVVMPATLALAEELQVSGQQLIEAIVVGFDVCIRIGEAVTPAHYQYFHTTGTAGTFGAAASASKLLKLSVQETIDALGTAGTQAAGLWEFIETGAMSKHLHSGKAGFNGLLAALLARQGFTGAPTIIEGKRGFMNAMASAYDEGRVLDKLGTRYTILENCYKIHSSCRHTHHVIDLVLQLVVQHDLHPNDIDRIDIGTYKVALDITDNPNPQTVYAGKFSVQYCAALASVKRGAGLGEFTEMNLNDPVVREVLSRVHVHNDPKCEVNYPEKWGSNIRIMMKDGKEFYEETDYPKGDFENPVSSDELIDKFTGLTEGYLDRTDQKELVRRCLSLEKVEDLSSLFA